METGSNQRSAWAPSARQLLWKLSDRAREFRERQTLSSDVALGRRGEDLAHRYLRSKQFTILARNYRPRGGESEVDIIARQSDITVFVEVKSRSSAEFGTPERAIDEEKQKQIYRAARAYAMKAGIEWTRVRFDIVSIVFTNPPSIRHEQDAFFRGRAI